MFDIGFLELLVIGIVALIVIGPKDLPEMFRQLGRFTAKARSMAREFSRAMEAAADEAGVKDVSRDLKNMTSAKSLGLDAVKEAATKFEKWSPAEALAKAKKGPETAKLTEERAETARKIQQAAADKAQARLDAAAAKEAEDWEREDAEGEAQARRPAAKKPDTKKPAAAKPAAKKTAAKAARTSASKAAPAAKTATKVRAKPAAGATKKPAARKAASKAADKT